MNGRKAKNRAILFLLAANVLIFGILAVFLLQHAGANRRSDARRVQWLEANGIASAESVWRDFDGAVARYYTYKSTRLPETLAKVLLTGTVTSSTAQTGTVTWVGNNGTLVWSEDNVLTAQLQLTDYAQPTNTRQAEALTKRFLDLAGWQGEIRTEEDTAGYSVTVTQMVDGLPVENAALTFFYAQDGSLTVSGGWCVGQTAQPELDRVEETTVDRLLAALIRERAGYFTKIGSLRVTYVMMDGGSGTYLLTPCWVFQTDMDAYGVTADGTVLTMDELPAGVYAPTSLPTADSDTDGEQPYVPDSNSAVQPNPDSTDETDDTGDVDTEDFEDTENTGDDTVPEEETPAEEERPAEDIPADGLA